MSKKRIAKVMYAVTMILAFAGILTLIFAPMIRGSEYISIDMMNGYTYLNGLTEELKNLSQTLENETFATFLMGSLTGIDSNKLIACIEKIETLPLVYLISMSIAIISLVLTVIWSILGIVSIKQKWHTPKALSVFGFFYLLSNVFLAVRISMCVQSIVELSGELGQSIYEIGGDIMKIEPLSVMDVLSYIGPGIFVPLICVIVICVLGFVIPVHDINSDKKLASSENAVIGGIIGESGFMLGYEIELRNKEQIVIGSDPKESQLIIPDSSIEGVHCVIQCFAEENRRRKIEVLYEVTCLAKSGMYFSDGSKLGQGQQRMFIPNTVMYIAKGENSFRMR